MQRISYLIKKRTKTYNIDDKISNYKARQYWEKTITSMLPQATGKTMVVSLEKGILKIAALSKEIADFIIIYSKRIISELNGLTGRMVVFRIVCEHC